jgi:hypothetical protein
VKQKCGPSHQFGLIEKPRLPLREAGTERIAVQVQIASVVTKPASRLLYPLIGWVRSTTADAVAKGSGTVVSALGIPDWLNSALMDAAKRPLAILVVRSFPTGELSRSGEQERTRVSRA